MERLRDLTAAYIRDKVDKDKVHTPQITGNPLLAKGGLQFVAGGAAAAEGINRKKLLQLAAAQPNHFDMKTPKVEYAVDQAIKFTLPIPTAGYLNVVSVDAKDNAIVLFPNRYQENNQVAAGAFVLPTPQMAFALLVAEPLGPTLVVSFLSADPINFYHETLDNRDQNGNITVDFSSLSHTATRAIRIAPRKSETYSSQLELKIIAKSP